MATLTLNQLRKAYPPASNTIAVIGYIPMDEFNANEKAIRKVTQAEGLRSVYRGPRRNWMASFTRRADAVGVTFYRK